MALKEMNLPRFPLLTNEEMVGLLTRANQGDQDARERLINCNLRLVFNLVQRFENRGYDLEDLFQIGTIGLIKAIDKFDLTYNVRFSTYAVPMIVGEIRRFLRDDSPIRISRALKETAFKVQRMKEELTRDLGREPSINEVAVALALPREDIVAAMEAAQSMGSIHDTLYQEDGDPIYLLDQLGSEDNQGLVDHLALDEVLKQLPDKYRRIILLRFFQDKTQTEVASMVGLSQVQVSRLERQALQRLKELLDVQAETEEARHSG